MIAFFFKKKKDLLENFLCLTVPVEGSYLKRMPDFYAKPLLMLQHLFMWAHSEKHESP